MFVARTNKLKDLASIEPHRIKELEEIFQGRTNIYIDFANVRPWANHLGWHIEIERLGDLLRSFDTIGKRRIYHGTLVGDLDSSIQIGRMTYAGFDVVTKPVKIMKHSIDVSSIAPDSPNILKTFIRPALLRQLKLEAIQYLNTQLRTLNQEGQLYIEDRKCNFDVEIGRDMVLDHAAKACDTFVLWSGDSDFADPIRQLLKDGKRVYLFATARQISKELNALRDEGLVVYDIRKLRDFICWKREMTQKAT